MKKQVIVVASNNTHKLREIAQIFEEYEVISQREAGFDEEVEETGTTFEENALLKARAACKALGLPVIADDSGLCVLALNGAPGAYSARYCGWHADDQSNRALLLKNMEQKSDRTAYFCSSIVMVYPDGKELIGEGRTYGKILEKEDGEGGFGYDPIFFSDDLQKSFGRATAEEKNSVSHRYRALCVLREKAGL